MLVGVEVVHERGVFVRRLSGLPRLSGLTQTPALAGGAALSQNKTRRRLYEAVLWFLCEVYFVPVTATELNRSAVLSS